AAAAVGGCPARVLAIEGRVVLDGRTGDALAVLGSVLGVLRAVGGDAHRRHLRHVVGGAAAEADAAGVDGAARSDDGGLALNVGRDHAAGIAVPRIRDD